MFAPAYCIYMAKLQKEGPFGIVTFSGFFYALTELARVLLLGVLGLGTSGEPTSFAFGTELLNVLLSALTVVGVWAALNHKFNATMKMLEFEQRIVCVALGFSVVQSVMHYGPALWIDARGPEFDWRFVRMGVQANIDLLLHLAFTAAVFVAKERFAKGQAVSPVAVGIVGVCLLVPSVMWCVFARCVSSDFLSRG